MARIRREGTHTHPCTFAAAGCKNTVTCSDIYLERNHDPDGVICGINSGDTEECEECFLSRCDECGHVLAIDKQHDDECSKATAV